MPRLPRLSRGDGQPSPEHEGQEPSTQERFSGDPLAAPPAPREEAPPSRADLTSGDPLAMPAEGPPPTAHPPVDAAPAVEEAPPVDAAPAVEEAPPVVGAEEWGAAEPAPSADAAPAGSESLLSAEQPTTAQPMVSGDPLAAPTAHDQPTAHLPAVDPNAMPPASTSALVAAPGAPAEQTAEVVEVVEETPVDATPRFRERTRLRRRMRELRRMREIAFRDLGGLVFDLHRFGRDRNDLVADKLGALGQLDHELRTIEGALRERREVVELREAGIAACPRCATLHGTDANFCPGCGTPLRGSVVREAGPLRVAPDTGSGEAPAGAEATPPAGGDAGALPADAETDSTTRASS